MTSTSDMQKIHNWMCGSTKGLPYDKVDLNGFMLDAYNNEHIKLCMFITALHMISFEDASMVEEYLDNNELSDDVLNGIDTNNSCNDFYKRLIENLEEHGKSNNSNELVDIIKSNIDTCKRDSRLASHLQPINHLRFGRLLYACYKKSNDIISNLFNQFNKYLDKDNKNMEWTPLHTAILMNHIVKIPVCNEVLNKNSNSKNKLIVYDPCIGAGRLIDAFMYYYCYDTNQLELNKKNPNPNHKLILELRNSIDHNKLFNKSLVKVVGCDTDQRSIVMSFVSTLVKGVNRDIYLTDCFNKTIDCDLCLCNPPYSINSINRHQPIEFLLHTMKSSKVGVYIFPEKQLTQSTSNVYDQELLEHSNELDALSRQFNKSILEDLINNVKSVTLKKRLKSCKQSKQIDSLRSRMSTNIFKNAILDDGNIVIDTIIRCGKVFNAGTGDIAIVVCYNKSLMKTPIGVSNDAVKIVSLNHNKLSRKVPKAPERQYTINGINAIKDMKVDTTIKLDYNKSWIDVDTVVNEELDKVVNNEESNKDLLFSVEQVMIDNVLDMGCFMFNLPMLTNKLNKELKNIRTLFKSVEDGNKKLVCKQLTDVFELIKRGNSKNTVKDSVKRPDSINKYPLLTSSKFNSSISGYVSSYDTDFGDCNETHPYWSITTAGCVVMYKHTYRFATTSGIMILKPLLEDIDESNQWLLNQQLEKMHFDYSHQLTVNRFKELKCYMIL